MLPGPPPSAGHHAAAATLVYFHTPLGSVGKMTVQGLGGSAGINQSHVAGSTSCDPPTDGPARLRGGSASAKEGREGL